MKLIYNTDATPKQMGYGQTLLFALQQLLAILAATILVPMIVNPAEMTVSAALFNSTGRGTPSRSRRNPRRRSQTTA